jgi:alpha,alpha-trehalase
VLTSTCLELARAEEHVSASLPVPPDQTFGELFVAIQRSQVFDDQKTFMDALPLFAPERILALYRAQRQDPKFNLAAFVHAHFRTPSAQSVSPPSGQSLREHIDWLWPRLARNTPAVPAFGSLLALPKPYVVPGGRFREVYYWDSYFTMLGLEQAGRGDLVDAMLDDFASLITRFGHVPNGNRTYYLSRSQPPFFSHMVALAAERRGPQVYAQYLPQLRREHAYWMAGEQGLRPNTASRRVVALPDGTRLNRYWDDLDTPRPESYLQDLQTAEEAPQRSPAQVYRDLRAAAESGWDFSSRWLGDRRSLSSIRTTSMIPVDLNSLLFHLEMSIAKGCELTSNPPGAREFTLRAAQRAQGIERHLWNEAGYYDDYDWERAELRQGPTAAMLYPLFVGIASGEHAQRTTQSAQAQLLGRGGLGTTTYVTGQQWDAPNAWAPLQWIAIVGLRRYAEAELARRIGTSFLANVSGHYATSGKLVEKYDVDEGHGGGGGEYPLQDGFGWTNGVISRLLDLYEATPNRRRGASQRAPSVELSR